MRLLFITLLISITQLSLVAQTTNNPSQTFFDLKSAFAGASKGKEIRELSKQLDNFLSHVKIERASGVSHNLVPYLTCYYNSLPLSTPAILSQEERLDTIQFQNGRWYITRDFSSDAEISLLCIEQPLNNSKSAKKSLETLCKRHILKMNEELLGKNSPVFYVREENLYYAAIESKKIPSFEILSNSEILNYASCLKAILKASYIDATYDEILSTYLNTTLDEQFIPSKNCSNTIAGRKVVTTFLSKNKVNATTIVNELIRERFVIAIDKDGNVGLLTAVALTGETNYQPVHVRLRMPMTCGDNQRVQMSWEDFSSRLLAIVKVDIY